MIAGLLVALLTQTSTTIECAVSADIDEGRRSSAIFSLSADCGSADPEAQIAAQSSLDQIDLSERFANGTGVAPAIVMTNSDGRWAPAPGQYVTYRHVQIPPRIVERGYRHLACSIAARPDSGGRLADLQTYCLVDGADRHNRLIVSGERALADALSDARLLPTDTAYCMADEISVSAAVIFVERGRRYSEQETQAPPVSLPNLCTPD
ncbi:hypothetical protein [Hyphobacterium sp.]|uniref:hypothetical protein n=1 Tax=Hyphobacterium sp. TaxID=2004662 RepID=UPI003BAD4A7E